MTLLRKNSETDPPAALITGITGQDGAYLAQLLLEKGYRVAGTTRNLKPDNLWRLRRLGILDRLELLEITKISVEAATELLKRHQCSELYALSAQSSVGISFEKPLETIRSIVCDTADWLEAVRRCDRPIRVFLPSSSELFADVGETPIDEKTDFLPRNPYGTARLAQLHIAREYRQRYEVFVSIGFLFNHESPLRGASFVTQKIAHAACRIAENTQKTLMLGKIDIIRDWGWAPEYAEAMWRMLQSPTPCEYVIATGESCTLESYLENVFEYFGLNWKEKVSIAPAFFRQEEPVVIRANPGKIARDLGWTATMHMPVIAVRMAEEAKKKPFHS